MPIFGRWSNRQQRASALVHAEGTLLNTELFLILEINNEHWVARRKFFNSHHRQYLFVVSSNAAADFTNVTELEQYIKSYFGVVETNDLSTIVSLFKLTTIKKGDFLLKSGNRCNKLSFVQSGFLRMFVSTGKKEITQWISTKGNFSADVSSFIFETPSRLSIQALADTEISSISKDEYKSLGALVPKWNKFEKLFIVSCFIILEERVFSHLSMTAEERYYYFFKNNKELFNEVPLQFIASMLGMTPETFSRIRKKQLL